MGDLFAFRAHRTPTIFGAGSAGDAERLCSLLNRHRASNKFSVEPVTDAGSADLIDIAGEIKANLTRSTWDA